MQNNLSDAGVVYGLALKALDQERDLLFKTSILIKLQNRYFEMSRFLYELAMDAQVNAQATDHLQLAVDFQVKAIQILDCSQSEKIFLISLYINLVKRYAQQNDVKNVLFAFKKGLEIADNLKPETTEISNELNRRASVLHCAFADFCIQCNSCENGLLVALQAIKKREAIVEKTMEDNIEVGRLHAQIGKLCLKLNKVDEAIYHFQRSIIFFETVLQHDPNSKDSYWCIFSLYKELSKIYFTQGNLLAIIDYYEKAIKSLSNTNSQVLEQLHKLFAATFFKLQAWEYVLKASKAACEMNAKHYHADFPQDKENLESYKQNIRIAEKSLEEKSKSPRKKRPAEGDGEEQGSPTKKQRLVDYQSVSGCRAAFLKSPKKTENHVAANDGIHPKPDDSAVKYQK